MKNPPDSNRFPIIVNPTDDEMKEFQKRLEAYNMKQTNGEYNSPEIEISLVLKDDEGDIVGGVIASTLLWTMWLEILWVDDKYRGLGYGRDLVLEAERIGKKNGCITSQTFSFSWQAPEFYQIIGYNLIGIYDGYVEGITEHVLMKRLDTIDDASFEKVKSTRFTIAEDSTEESQNILRKGIGKYGEEQVGELRKENPGINIKLIIKNDDGQVLGGLLAGTTLKTMYINKELWVDERYRGMAMGRIS